MFECRRAIYYFSPDDCVATFFRIVGPKHRYSGKWRGSQIIRLIDLKHLKKNLLSPAAESATSSLVFWTCQQSHTISFSGIHLSFDNKTNNGKWMPRVTYSDSLFDTNCPWKNSVELKTWREHHFERSLNLYIRSGATTTISILIIIQSKPK